MGDSPAQSAQRDGRIGKIPKPSFTFVICQGDARGRFEARRSSDRAMGLALLESSGENGRQHLKTRSMLQLRVQRWTGGIRLVLRDLRTIVMSLFCSMVIQRIFRVVARPRGKVRDS